MYGSAATSLQVGSEHPKGKVDVLRGDSQSVKEMAIVLYLRLLNLNIKDTGNPPQRVAVPLGSLETTLEIHLRYPAGFCLSTLSTIW